MFLAVTAVLGVVLVVLLVVVPAIIYSETACSPEEKQVSNSLRSQIPKMDTVPFLCAGEHTCRHIVVAWVNSCGGFPTGHRRCIWHWWYHHLVGPDTLLPWNTSGWELSHGFTQQAWQEPVWALFGEWDRDISMRWKRNTKSPEGNPDSGTRAWKLIDMSCPVNGWCETESVGAMAA